MQRDVIGVLRENLTETDLGRTPPQLIVSVLNTRTNIVGSRLPSTEKTENEPSPSIVERECPSTSNTVIECDLKFKLFRPDRFCDQSFSESEKRL